MNKKDYKEYYIQGSNHYLIPKEEFEELFEDINTWKKEYEFLKKVSSDYTYIINEAIEYLESYNVDFARCEFGEAPISIRELDDLLKILKGEE